ncbi:esterase [Planctomycetes bacterium Poly30]|uniref:Esterase n=1 Tax=Saltatorellus ferox TaxID=2528018 RepID=A0A518EM16_9BACT|nr:esterase [Planctomycetes bacterium Poly30]
MIRLPLSLGLPFAATVFMSTSCAEEEFVPGHVTVHGVTTHYRLLAPETIEEGQRYPLILFLHGAGERGSDNELQLKHFPSKMLTPERRAAFPCFLLAPQCPEEGRWTTDNWGSKSSQPLPSEPTDPMAGAIAALIRTVGEQAIDMDRIYLTGLSMGGYGTFELATRYPDWFAAAAPVCGGGDERSAARLVGLPLSVWHGDADQAVPVENSRQIVAELKELGIEADYHELPGVGHDAWTAAYGADGCLDWLFAQRRDPARRAALAGELLARAIAPDERIAFLGDSITEQGADAGGYVDILRSAIQRVQPEASVIAAGISGHKVPDLLRREERDVRAKDASLVFLYIGINDVWHSERGEGTPKDAFRSGLEELLQRLEGPGGATVAMATPSVIGEGPAGTGSLDGMLEEYAAISARFTGPKRRALCDLQVRFRDHLRLFNPEGKKSGVLTTDGVHLNEAGNQFVAAEAALALRAAAARRATVR